MWSARPGTAFDRSVGSPLFPPGTNFVGECLWSPDGTWIICNAYIQRDTASWAVGRANLPSLIAFTPPGQLIAWIPEAPR